MTIPATIASTPGRLLLLALASVLPMAAQTAEEAARDTPVSLSEFNVTAAPTKE